MKMDDETPENIVKYGQFIKHIHIAEKEDRAVPGTYNEDFSSYFSALKEINYQGMISIEARWEDMEKQAPLGIKIIKQQLKQIK
jgi:sugar phosphate isomerase/epimerase